MDVIVIGGGIVGVSAALTLAEAGATVTVLERKVVAGEASGLNAGLIGGGGWGDEPDIETVLRMGSRDRFIDLAERRGHDIGLDLTGTLTLVRTGAEWDWAVATVEADRAAGKVTELVAGPDLIGLEPAADPELLGAILDPLGARAEPVAATRAFAAEVVAAGGVIETGAVVRSLAPVDGGGWEVGVDIDGRRERRGADAVVVAAGPWCAEIGAMVGVEVPIVAVRGQMWATEPQPPMLLWHGIAAAESPLAWEGESAAVGEPPHLTHRSGRRVTRHVYGRQRPNGEIVFGGDRVLVGDLRAGRSVEGADGPVEGAGDSVEGAGRAVDEEGIAVNHGHVGELVPVIGALTPVRTWAGLMPFSLDGAPLIGPVTGHDGLFLAGGLASSGFGRGPMAGDLVAKLVLGERPGFDLSGVDPGQRPG